MWSHGCRSSINIKNDPKLLGLGLMDQWTSGGKIEVETTGKFEG